MIVTGILAIAVLVMYWMDSFSEPERKAEYQLYLHRECPFASYQDSPLCRKAVATVTQTTEVSYRRSVYTLIQLHFSEPGIDQTVRWNRYYPHVDTEVEVELWRNQISTIKWDGGTYPFNGNPTLHYDPALGENPSNRSYTLAIFYLGGGVAFLIVFLSVILIVGHPE